jgi:hypothetical protein
MLKALAKSVAIKAVQKRVGVSQPGSVTAALLTTGATLLLSRGRRPVGLALIAVGGFLLWRENEPESSTLRPIAPPPPESASGGAA